MTNYRKKLLWLYARKRGSGSGGISVSVSGTTPVTLANAIESAIRHMTQFGKLTQSGTPTTANPVDIVCNNGALKWDSENQRIYADGTPEVLTVSADDVEDQTASVENLLAVGNVRDEQDIITGKVIRRTEAFMYDGSQTVKPTFMSTTGGKDDGAIIVQPRGAEYAGDVVSFEAEEGKHIDSLKVTLTPTQEGTGDPSPDNIRPITGTEQAEVVRTGKNVLNPILYDGGSYNPSVGAVWNLTVAPDARQFTDNHDGTFTYTTSSTWDYRVMLFPVKQSDSRYNVSIQGASSGTFGRSVGYLDKNLTVLSKENTTETSWTYTQSLNPSADPNRAYFYILLTNRNTASATITITNPSVVVDGDALPYEPYKSTTLQIEWGADVGTIYGGSVDAVMGEIVLNKASYTWDGSIPFTVQNNVFVNNKAGIRTRDASVVSDKIVISNMFKSGGVGYRSECTDGSIIKVRGANTQIACYSSAFASVDDFNAYLAQHPMTMVYDLAQPITLQIDPQTLTALAKNTVWADAGSVDVLLNDELVETVAKQPLKTAEGDNTVSVVSEVGEVELAVTYKGGNS